MFGYVGVYLCEFGNFVQYIPAVINGLQNNGYNIDFAGFNDLKYILNHRINSKAINSFVGFDYYNNIKRLNTTLDPLPTEISQYFNSIDKTKYKFFWPMHNISNDENVSIYLSAPKIFRRLTYTNNKEYKNSVIIFPRGSSRFQEKNIPKCIWQNIIDFLVSCNLSIYIGGLEHNTILGLINCFYLYNFQDQLLKSIEMLNNCAACITTTCGGSVLATSCGCPTFVIGNARHKHLYYRINFDPRPGYYYNYLESFVEYYECDLKTIDISNCINRIESFIKKYSHYRIAKDEVYGT